jgi:signal transduction histidine kinase
MRRFLDLATVLHKTPMTLAVTSGVVATLLAMLAAELVMPPRISISAFVFIPVLVAGWFLPARLVWPMVAAASAIRVIALLEGPANALTVSAEITMLITIGAVAMFAADRFRTWQAAEVALCKLTARNAAAAEQERIALQLTQDVARNLFAATLDLQSAMELVETEPARRRIATAQGRLDAQIADLRHVVFARSADRAVDPDPMPR